MNPIVAIDQAFLQLTFAIKLLAHVELGRLSKSDFDGEVLVKLRKRNLNFPSQSFNTDEDIRLAAENNYSITLGFSALVLDRALSDRGLSSDLTPSSPYRDLRSLVYMVRCAFAHDMMQPRWEARGVFARELRITLPSGALVVDVRALNGQPFMDSHIGGVETYFELKDEVARIVSLPIVP
jgi:hypothetical protein